MTNDPPQHTLEQLTEHVADWHFGELAVDQSLRLVRNIALTGTESKNGYRYSEQALRDAVSLYDGKPVFLDHAANLSRPFERSTRDLAGTIVSPRFHEGRIRADVQLLDTEAGRTFLALANSKSSTIGMSHVVLAERTPDRATVAKIHDVISVDAVVFPATTSTFQESVAPQDDHPAPPLQPDVSELQAQIDLLIAERDALLERLHLLESEQERARQRTEVDAILAEAALPAWAVTELFRSQLLTADPESRPLLIRERQTFLKQLARHGPFSRERIATDDGPSDAAVIAAIRGSRRVTV